jgi:hypothetical protein
LRQFSLTTNQFGFSDLISSHLGIGLIVDKDPKSILKPRVSNQKSVFLNPIIRTEEIWTHEHKKSKGEE